MELQKSRQRISVLMSMFFAQVEGAKAMGENDISHIAETMLIPIFNEIYGYKNLKNLNFSEKSNYPSVDLGDEVSRVAIQVTATSNNEKIKDTLRKFVKYKLYEKYDRVIIYILTKKENSYSGRGYKSIIKGCLQFDKDKDIQDYTDILKVISSLQLDEVRKIERILEKNFGNPNASYKVYSGREVADRVEELLHDYTYLFVGRETELETIDKFLLENGSGILTVTGKAGFGKTALLANWIKHSRKKDLFVAYHFFNQRYEVTRSTTNGYRNLLNQVFTYYDLAPETISIEDRNLHEVLYGILQERGARPAKPLVIVIDGLDEAEQILLPFQVSWPKGIYVIVSARADGEENPIYLADWSKKTKPLHLENLASPAIAEYLSHVGNGELIELAKDDQFIEKVERNTQGFPLYLRFLSEELINTAQSGQDVLEVLAKTPKEFRGYVKHQFGQLAKDGGVKRNKKLRKLFSLLTVALGSLTSNEITQLTGLDVWELQDLPWQVTRWFSIQHPENAPSLYTFSHPLLAREFANILEQDGQSAQDILLRFCRSWSKHNSPYALQYYVPHLAEINEFDELFTVASNTEFRQAQEQHLPNDPGLPLRTTRTALLNAITADDPIAMAEFTLDHARQVKTITEQSPLETLRAGYLERAWKLAEIGEQKSRILWYLLLIWELVDEGRLADAEATLKLIYEVEPLRLSGWQGEYAAFLLKKVADYNQDHAIILSLGLLEEDDLISLALYFASDGQISLALMLAASPDEDWHQINAFCRIATTSVRSNYINNAQMAFQCAIAIALDIKDTREQSKFIADIAKSQVEVNLIEDALVLAEHTSYLIDYIEVMSSLVPAMITNEDKHKAQSIISSVIEMVKQVTNVNERTWLLHKIGRIQAAAGFLNEATALLDSITDTELSEMVLLDIVKNLASSSDINKALHLLNTILNTSNKIDGLCAVALAQTHAGADKIAQQTFAEALSMAMQIKGALDRALELEGISLAQAEAGYIQAAVATAKLIPSEHGFDDVKDEAVGLIALGQARMGDIIGALQLLRDKTGLNTRELSQIAKIHAQSGNIEQALWLAGIIMNRNIFNGADALLTIAKVQITQGHSTEARSNLAVALTTKKFEYLWWRVLAESLSDIAKIQIDCGHIDEARTTLSNASMIAKMIRVSPNWLLDFSLEKITQLQLQIGHYDDAMETALALDDEHWKASCIEMVNRAKNQVHYLNQKPHTVKHPILNGKEKTQIQANPPTLIELLTEARGKQSLSERIEDLCTVAVLTANCSDIDNAQVIFDEALMATRQIEDEDTRNALFEEISNAQARAGLIEEALRTAKESDDYSAALKSIVEGLLEADLLDEALRIATTIPHELIRGQILSKVAIAFAKKANMATAKKIIDDLIASIQEDNSEGWNTDILVAVAKAQATVGFGSQAVQTIQMITRDHDKHLPEVASLLTEKGDKDNFKRLLLACAYYDAASYNICSSIAKLYPERASTIANIVLSYSRQDIEAHMA
ncbi:MAG: ATP-binding protein [Abitibacteriaceae bacterium]|nr:ATP-binding protein [Abditibacteriaceae bacterium]